jgi:hypothetical protein
MSWHAALPWDWFRAQYRKLRSAFFSRPRHEGTYYRVEVPLEEAEAALGRQSYAPNWEVSYNKRGEVLNLAQVVWEYYDGTPYRWWQTHVRGYEAPGGALDLNAHWELEPTETDVAHLNGVGVSVERGMRNLESALEAAGIDHEEVEYER